MSPRDRAAAILVLVFGQQVSDVVKLTWDHVQVTDEDVTITLGTVEIALTHPLDMPLRQLAAAPTHDQTATRPNSSWVFRGGPPGRHLRASSLTQRPSTAFSSRAARLGTLHELTKVAPVAIIAEALGYSPITIERHAIDSSANYAQYVGSVARAQSQKGSSAEQ
ncbi:site-specific integrase [Arthrobacter sp. NtRootA1]|uniref:site-specific integrase n=1 Tax=Arthrobacter sp. NtRootA1 TaxID=2830983 RepID=UPI001CC4860F|nr:site-specific integrase [Arthrobacter sp. NtRootA1]BCW06005.1 hypothetical protein NtRootA1_21430 [Arthrobacter sp. NtRootA1]